MSVVTIDDVYFGGICNGEMRRNGETLMLPAFVHTTLKEKNDTPVRVSFHNGVKDCCTRHNFGKHGEKKFFVTIFKPDPVNCSCSCCTSGAPCPWLIKSN